MTKDPSVYFATVAQVIPALLILVAIDLAVLRWLNIRWHTAESRWRYRLWPWYWSRVHYVESEEELAEFLPPGVVPEFSLGALVLLVCAAEGTALASIIWPPTDVALTTALILTGSAVLLLGLIALGLLRTSLGLAKVVRAD